MQTNSCHPCETLKDEAVSTQACISLDLEQRRRMLDLDGERTREALANKTARLIQFTPYTLKHVPWPVESLVVVVKEETTFSSIRKEVSPMINQSWQTIQNAFGKAAHIAEDTLNMTADAVSAFTNKTADIASSVGKQTVDVAEKTVEVASAMKQKTVVAASNFGQVTVDIAAYVRPKAVVFADTISQKTLDAANIVSHKTSDVAAAINHKTSDVVHVVGDVATVISHKTQDVAAVVMPLATEIALEAKQKLVHIADDIVYSTTKSYVKTVTEVERRRRAVDTDEQYAILNALTVSGIIKGLGYEFYRQSEQSFCYSFRLLEGLERRWRMYPQNSVVAHTNAKKVSLLLAGKFSSIARTQDAYTAGKIHIIANEPLPPMAFAKVEVVETPIPKVYTPAL